MSLLLIAADLTVPTNAATAAADPNTNKYTLPSATPSASSQPGAAPPSGFNAVDDSTQMQSGEALLIEAYIAIWVLLFGFIVAAWLRTRRVEDKVVELEKAIERAKVAAPIPTTKRSASEPPGGLSPTGPEKA